MDILPIDMSHPAVRDYISLIRLQVLTPLSLLINIATVLVCTVIVSPGIAAVTKEYPTSISPSPFLIAIYVCVLYAGQIGYCFLLVLARKPETKVRLPLFRHWHRWQHLCTQRTLVKGVGLSLVFSNWVMAGWAIAWVFQAFLASTILLGILILLLLYSNISLLTYHHPTMSRPFDMALIHAPLRFFMILPITIMFPVSLLYALPISLQLQLINFAIALPWASTTTPPTHRNITLTTRGPDSESHSPSTS